MHLAHFLKALLRPKASEICQPGAGGTMGLEDIVAIPNDASEPLNGLPTVAEDQPCAAQYLHLALSPRIPARAQPQLQSQHLALSLRILVQTQPQLQIP